MTRAFRAIAACSVLLCLVPLVGCPTENWGDTAIGFVEGTFPEISHDYAVAQLDHVWLSGFFASAEDGDVRVKQWVAQLPVNPDPEAIDLPTATHEQHVKAYIAVDTAIAALDTEYQELGTLQHSLEIPGTVCSDRHLFDSRGLDWVGLYGPISMIQPRLKAHEDTFEFYVQTSFSFDESGDAGGGATQSGDLKPYLQPFVQAWQGLTDHNHTNEQNDKLSQALAELPSKAVQPDTAFQLSKVSCTRAFNTTATMRHDAVAEAGDFAQVIAHRRALLVVRRDLIGSYLRPEEVAAVANSDTGHALLSQTQNAFLKGDIAMQVNMQMQAAKLVGWSAVLNTHCSERLRLFERYHDILVELEAQLTVLQQLEGSQGAAQATTELNAIHTFEADYPATLKRLSSTGCQ